MREYHSGRIQLWGREIPGFWYILSLVNLLYYHWTAIFYHSTALFVVLSFSCCTDCLVDIRLYRNQRKETMKLYNISRTPFQTKNVAGLSIPIFFHKNRVVFRSAMEMNYLENNCEGLNHFFLTRYWVCRPMLFKLLKTQFVNEDRIKATIKAKKSILTR